MNDLVTRAVSADEFQTAVDWAMDEGWNPGLDDLAVFHAADPKGFLMGFRDGEPVSSISVVRYGDDYGFLGFYIAHSGARGTGAGIAIWNAGMAYLEGRTVGLDGVVAQQDNYKKSGFVLAGRNIRYRGVPDIGTVTAAGVDIREVTPGDFTALLPYDRSFFGAPRDGFASAWACPGRPVRRRGMIAIVDGELAGYGVIRECLRGYKIGPLFAETEAVAAGLFAALLGRAAPGSDISIDPPESNKAATRFAEQAGMAPVFETARMYKGPAPELPIDRIFGLTTFELG
jgi:Acetyltransferase (GNAT) domain/Acetyltransferase (GNAT) family